MLEGNYILFLFQNLKIELNQLERYHLKKAPELLAWEMHFSRDMMVPIRQCHQLNNSIKKQIHLPNYISKTLTMKSS